METPWSTPLRVFILVLTLTAATLACGDEGEDSPCPPLVPRTVLTTNAFGVGAPVFHDADRAGVEWTDLLQALPGLPGETVPGAGREFAGPQGRSIAWTVTSGADDVFDLKTDSDGAAARYLAVYIVSDRWQKATLAAVGDHLLAGRFDGADLDLKKEDGKDGAGATWSAELTLPLGKHLVVLRSLRAPDTEADWSYGLSLTPGDQAAEGSLTFAVDPEHSLDIDTVLNAPRVSDVSVSADGRLAAISLSAYRNGHDREQWLEIRDVRDGKLMRLWRGSEAPGPTAWHPQGRRLTWQSDHEDKSTLHLFDFDTGETSVVLADVEHLGSWRWAPDGKSVLFEISREAEADERKVKHVANPQDRQPWWRNRTYLNQVFVPGGLTRRLTAGPLSPESWRLSPDGRQLVFFLSEPDITHRPFSTSEMWLLDMETLAAEKVLADPWVGGAEWSPDGRKLCMQGSPSAFDGLGRTLPEGVQANDYGGQMYLFDLKSGQAEPITRDLVPDVSGCAWSRHDGYIYAEVTETQYHNVYRWKPGRKTWQRMDTGFEATAQVALAADAPTAVVRGTSVSTPNRVHVVDLERNKARLLLDPGVPAYADIAFGRVEDYAVTLPDGGILDGFVYYPPGFDPARTYPVIVYYYGGTSPITRDFGGRYPKNTWAAQGYLVYVPNPSGATGYGQAYAARHVNDWGILTAPEVIAGTQAFLADHPFADADHVGCIGASYGGFLTQYLVTQTDIFAAAVSHAGISSISSYWGEGLWGYAYGARALANAYPWQDRELYIEQSPLFLADRITTPLLLLHGDSDTNVPPGESDQLFTALKILDRPVEYVEIQEQDHWILDHEQRVVWHDTILAYFARYLKEQPAWWKALYPAPETY